MNPHDVPLPHFVQIEPVGQCNLRCRMCPIAYRGEGLRGAPPAFMAKEGVAAVWSNEAYRRFRAQLASGEPPEICKGCAVYNGNF